jgi:hypothetical protein
MALVYSWSLSWSKGFPQLAPLALTDDEQEDGANIRQELPRWKSPPSFQSLQDHEGEFHWMDDSRGDAGSWALLSTKRFSRRQTAIYKPARRGYKHGLAENRVH